MIECVDLQSKFRRRDADIIESNGWKITIIGRFFSRRSVIKFLQFEVWRKWDGWRIGDTDSVGGIPVSCTAHDPKSRCMTLEITEST